ncbi:hypothetical protein [Desulfobacula sp.]|nr:hypothetical protein [Desulfobacula sp.]
MIIWTVAGVLTTGPVLSGWVLPASCSSAYAANQMMVDRPGDLLEIAENLTQNILTAQQVRDQILQKIQERSQKIKAIDQQLDNLNLTKDQRYTLWAQRNNIKREATNYRRKALAVVRKQMTNVFDALGKMRSKLEELKDDEKMVDPEVTTTFNKYFQVSAKLIKNSISGVKGADPRTVAMLATLERSLVVSQKNSDFLVKAIDKIKSFQKVVALYDARLSSLDNGLKMNGEELDSKKKILTVKTVIESTTDFMEKLDIEDMEANLIDDLESDSDDDLLEFSTDENKPRPISGGSTRKLLDRFSSGNALSNSL